MQAQAEVFDITLDEMGLANFDELEFFQNQK